MTKVSSKKFISKRAARYTKKQIFLRKLIPSFVICLIIGALGAVIGLNYLSGQVVVPASDITSDIVAAALNDGFGMTYSRITLNSMCDTDPLGYYSQVIEIYDSDRNLFMETKDCVYISVKYNADPQRAWYGLKADAEDSVLKITNTYPMQGDEAEYSYRINRFCTDGETFIPLKITILDDNSEIAVIDTGYENKVPDGFTVYSEGDFEKAWLMFSYDPAEEQIKQFLHKQIKQHGLSRVSIYNIDSLYSVRVVPVNGQTYYVAQASKLNVPKVLGAALGLIAPFMLIICLLFAWLLASREYAVMSAHYAMEDYRKDMTNKLAHDLKSPLMVISGYAENLNNNITADKREHYAAAILENVQYMDGIIQNVLQLSGLEEGAVKTELTQVDIASLISDIAKNYESRFEENNLTLSVNGNAVFTADKSLMRDIFDNLISNAVKYTDKGGSIVIGCAQDKVTVSNDCCGADKLDTSSLTEPFVKGDNARSGRKGSGLGLAIASKAAEKQGYALTVRAESGRFIAELRKK